EELDPAPLELVQLREAGRARNLAPERACVVGREVGIYRARDAQRAVQPYVELARLAAFEQPQAHELEVFLQLSRHRFGRRPPAADEEVARVPGKARGLDALEGVGTLVERIHGAPAVSGL